MRAACKKKMERNEIVCFYCTQSDIFLRGIARINRGNKNKLRTFQPQKWKKIKNSQSQTKVTGSYKKKESNIRFWASTSLKYIHPVQKQTPEVFYEKMKTPVPSLYFNKVGLATLLKKNLSGTGVILWILRNFQEHLFTEHLWTAAFTSGSLVHSNRTMSCTDALYGWW